MSERPTTTPYLHVAALLLVTGPFLIPSVTLAQPELWVDPVGGSDSLGTGRPALPVKSISRALELAQANTVIHLEPGTYSSHETFPLILPASVSLQGSLSDRGRSVTILGGGGFETDRGKAHNAAIVATGGGSIRGVTVSNPQGIGVLLPDKSDRAISDSTFLGNGGSGLAVLNGGTPTIQNNLFTGQGEQALSLGGSTSAQVSDNRFERNGTAIWIGDVAAPVVQNNVLQANRVGIETTGLTRPSLRGNRIEDSLATGIEISASSPPNFGSAARPGNNIIRNSSLADVRGIDPSIVIAAGNQIGDLSSAAATAPPTTVSAPPSRTSRVAAPATPIRRAPAPIAVTPPPARNPNNLPAPVESFRTPTTEAVNRRQRVTIPVPPPDNVVASAPPTPRTIQQEQQQIQALRSRHAPGPTTILAVQPTAAPTRSAAAPKTTVAAVPSGPPMRVLVPVDSYIEEERVNAIVPDAFSSSHNGRSVMQIGIFSDRENLADVRNRLERVGFNVLVVPR